MATLMLLTSMGPVATASMPGTLFILATTVFASDLESASSSELAMDAPAALPRSIVAVTMREPALTLPLTFPGSTPKNFAIESISAFLTALILAGSAASFGKETPFTGKDTGTTEAAGAGFAATGATAATFFDATGGFATGPTGGGAGGAQNLLDVPPDFACIFQVRQSSLLARTE